MDVNGEVKLKIIFYFLFFFFFFGGGGSGGRIGLGGQGGWERRIENSKKKWGGVWGASGWGVRVDVNGEVKFL